MIINPNRYYFILLIFIPLIIISLFVGNRDLSIGTDTIRYAQIYESQLSQFNLSYDNLALNEPFFIILSKIILFFNLSTQSYFFILSLLSFSILTYTISLICKLVDFRNNISKWIFILLALTLSLISPFTSSIQINVLKMGIAIPSLIISVIHLTNGKIIKFVIFALISFFFHYSMILFLILILGLLFSKKVLFFIYLSISILYLTGAMKNLILIVINQLGDVGSMNYYLLFFSRDNPLYRAGVRIDFWIFNTIFVVIAMIKTPRFSIEDYISKIYIISLFPFLILGFINYSDRLLNLPWLIIPIIISTKLTRIIPSNYHSYAIAYSLYIISTLFFLLNNNLL